MTKRKINIILGLAILALFSDCNSGPANRRMPDLRETYSSKDKKPFGAYIAYRQLEEMFYRNTLRNEKRSFQDSWYNLEGDGNTYICITNVLYSTDEDAAGIVDFAKKGNDVFISTTYLETNLTDLLECKLTTDLWLPGLMGKFYQNTGLRLKQFGLTDTSLYSYYYQPFVRQFSSFNKTNTRVLGVNENGDPDYIVIFKGRGRIFLHCEPRAFSNYFLLQRNNYQYLRNVFGYMKPYPDHIYWNEYYADNNRRRNDGKGFSSFDEILSHPPLAAAFWLAIILLLLYILFGSKRRQRTIPVVKPNENTTVTFTETIGRLYLQKKDNKNIADKMITYFNEYIRNKYFLNTNNINDDFITTLSRKSGLPREKVDSLYRAISHAHNNAAIDDYQLLSLNDQMQSFYKKSV